MLNGLIVALAAEKCKPEEYHRIYHRYLVYLMCLI